MWRDIASAVKVSSSGSFSAELTVPKDVPENPPRGVVEIRAHQSKLTGACNVEQLDEEFTIAAASGKGQGQPPRIVRSETFREGVLVYARVIYEDPDGDAEGFGFRGVKGSGWAEETHPFSSPSYGRVAPGRVDYPFNHACGGGNQYESDVEFWIYDKGGRRSPSMTVYLSCSASEEKKSAQPRVLRYVALGDSYSSGEGAGNYDAATDTADNKCHRSRDAWPRLLATEPANRLQLVAFPACSGAIQGNINVGGQYGEPAQGDQLAQVTPPPQLVTITIGGNDMGFARVLEDCWNDDCTRSGSQLERMRTAIQNTLPNQLRYTYRNVITQARGARVIVVGYPNVFPAANQSVGKHAVLHLKAAERQALRETATLLDGVVASSARAASLKYVSTLRTLEGHEMYTGASWVMPICDRVGTCAVKKLVTFDQGMAHLTKPGQTAIAAAVAAYLNRG